jgi:hypothetical protein
MSTNGHGPDSEVSLARHNLAIAEERLRRLLVLRDRIPSEIANQEALVLRLRILVGDAQPISSEQVDQLCRPAPHGSVRDAVWQALRTPATLEQLRRRCPGLRDGQIQGALSILRSGPVPRVLKDPWRGAPYRRNPDSPRHPEPLS